MRWKINKFTLLLILVFLTAFLIRLVLLNWTLQFGNNGDLTRYEDWGRIAHIYNFADTYTADHLSFSGSFPNNQPPGSLYIISGSYELWILAGKTIAYVTHTAPGSNTAVNTYLQHIIFKLPAIISDLGIGLLAYLITLPQAGRKRAIMASSLALFTPVIFYNSAVWGQMDSLNNLFFILSLFLAYRKNIILSILAFAASLYIKLSLLPLLPFYIIFLFFLSKKNIKRILMGIVLSVVAIILATLPVSSNPAAWLLTKIPMIAQGELQNLTVAAFNFWWMIFCHPSAGHNNIPAVTQIFLGITLQVWAYAAFALSVTPLLYFQLAKSKQFVSGHYFLLILSVAALLSFMLLPGNHDRYMYPVFPLLAIATALSKYIRTYFIIFCLLSLFNLSNIAYSWYPIVLDSTSTFYHVFYGDSFGWIVSILTTITAGWLYWKSFSEFKKASNASAQVENQLRSLAPLP